MMSELIPMVSELIPMACSMSSFLWPVAATGRGAAQNGPREKQQVIITHCSVLTSSRYPLPHDGRPGSLPDGARSRA